MGHGVQNWEVSKAENRGWETEQEMQVLIRHKNDGNIFWRLLNFVVEKRKEAHGDSMDKQQKKKIERDEEKLKNNNRDLSLVKMKSMLFIGFAFTALLSMFNSV